MRLRDLLEKGEISQEDYMKLYPLQSKSSAGANFRKVMLRSIYLGHEVLRNFREANYREVVRLREEGYGEEEALSLLLRKFLLKVPLSLKLWEEIEDEAKELGAEGWIRDRLAERKASHVQFVPVSRVLYEKMQEEVSKLLQSQREALKTKLVKRLNDAVEKTYREAKELSRKRKK